MIFRPFYDLTKRRSRLLVIALARHMLVEAKYGDGTAMMDASLSVAMRLADEPDSEKNAAILRAQRGGAAVVPDLWSSSALRRLAAACCTEDPRDWMRLYDEHHDGEGAADVDEREQRSGKALRDSLRAVGLCFLHAVPIEPHDPLDEALFAYVDARKGLIAAREAGMLGDLADRLGLYTVADHLHDSKPHPRGCWAIDSLLKPW